MHDTIALPRGEWIAISDGAIGTPVRVQNLGGGLVRIQATTGGAPASDRGALHLWSGEGDVVDLATRFPGVAGATELWAFSSGSGDLSVSHG